MRLNIHKCDICNSTYDFETEKDLFPLYGEGRPMSTINLQLGSTDANYYTREFDICATCFRKIIEEFGLTYDPKNKCLLWNCRLRKKVWPILIFYAANVQSQNL